jgi:hypothetical protein
LVLETNEQLITGIVTFHWLSTDYWPELIFDSWMLQSNRVRIRQEKSIRKFPSWKFEGNFSFEKWKHFLRKTKWRSFRSEFRKFSEKIVAIFFISHFLVQNYNNSQQNTSYLPL